MSANEKDAGIARRALLVGLAAVGVAVTRALRTPNRAETLADSDRRLAVLGARLAAANPRTARALARQVTRAVAGAPPSRRVSLARRHFLRPQRIRRELARGDVLMVDGWLLARSELAVCAFLHRLADRFELLA